MNINEAQSDITKVVGAFTVYKFIKLMSTPFRQMDAYKLGIIDDKGNFLRKSEDFTTDKEKRAADVFHRLIINLKKLVKLKYSSTFAPRNIKRFFIWKI